MVVAERNHPRDHQPLAISHDVLPLVIAIDWLLLVNAPYRLPWRQPHLRSWNRNRSRLSRAAASASSTLRVSVRSGERGRVALDVGRRPRAAGSRARGRRPGAGAGA